MRVFRKVVLPLVWVVLLTAIAVSLAVLAFGSDPEPPGSGVEPTGELVGRTVAAHRGTVENTLELRGTIKVDPPVSAEASHDGVINHFFVPVGAKVSEGDKLFQIKSGEIRTEGTGLRGDGDDAEAPEPRIRYHTVVAGADGRISSFTKQRGDAVTKGEVVGMIRQDTFHANASIRPVQLYRLLDMPESATVTITGGPAPFSCGDLSIGGSAAPDAADDTGEGDGPGIRQFAGDPQAPRTGGTSSISCRVPSDVRVFDGLDMAMSIDAGSAEDALVVPVTAVQGVVHAGTVWVIEDGEPAERKVELGLSDGTVVEVTKGLEEGEKVLQFVPGQEPTPGGVEGQMRMRMSR